MSLEILLLISGLIFGGMSVFLFSYALFSGQVDQESIAWSTGKEPSRSDSGVINFSRPLVHSFTLQHAQKVKLKNYRTDIDKKILTSGLTAELNVDEFIGLQILWGIFLPLVFFILSIALKLEVPPAMLLVMSVFGFYFPHMYANGKKKKRYQEVIVELPFFIDLLALSTEAGLDFVGAIQKLVDKSEESTLGQEFATVLKELKLGNSRAEALRAMADRLDINEVRSFVSVVVDADQTGASISRVLKDQSVQMRLERFVRAEKAGARASQLILLPLILFIVPAVFIMIIVPVVLSFQGGAG